MDRLVMDGRDTIITLTGRKGGLFYDTLGAEVPKIAICLLSPHLLIDWADFWHGGSFLVELPLKVAIFPFSPPHPPPPLP